jgi:hypothetical protein
MNCGKSVADGGCQSGGKEDEYTTEELAALSISTYPDISAGKGLEVDNNSPTAAPQTGCTDKYSTAPRSDLHSGGRLGSVHQNNNNNPRTEKQMTLYDVFEFPSRHHHTTTPQPYHHSNIITSASGIRGIRRATNPVGLIDIPIALPSVCIQNNQEEHQVITFHSQHNTHSSSEKHSPESKNDDRIIASSK